MACAGFFIYIFRFIICICKQRFVRLENAEKPDKFKVFQSQRLLKTP